MHFYKNFSKNKIVKLLDESLQEKAQEVLSKISKENLKEAISFFVENFQTLSQYYTSPREFDLRHSTPKQEHSILAQLLTFEFINPFDLSDTLDWPFTEDFTKELLSQAGKKDPLLFSKLLVGAPLSVYSLKKLNFSPEKSLEIIRTLRNIEPLDDHKKAHHESFKSKEKFHSFITQVKSKLETIDLEDHDQNKVLNLILNEFFAVHPKSKNSLFLTLEKIGFSHTSDCLLDSISNKRLVLGLGTS